MFHLVSSEYDILDERVTLVEILQDRFKIKDLHIEFEKRITEEVQARPGTRKHILARKAWLRSYLGVDRLERYHSEVDAFIKWMCELGYAREIEFERYIT